jgi:hypothetical protein
MSFVRISEQTETFALYNIKRLVFITEVERVYSAVRTESLYIKQIRFVFKGLNQFTPIKLTSLTFIHYFNSLTPRCLRTSIYDRISNQTIRCISCSYPIFHPSRIHCSRNNAYKQNPTKEISVSKSCSINDRDKCTQNISKNARGEMPIGIP